MTDTNISEYGGITMVYRANSVDENVIKDTLNDDIFYKGAPEYVPKKNDVIIDVGAHIGAFSVLASKRSPNARIYAIEPALESYQLLEQNIKLNKCDNVIPTKKALHNQRGEVKLFHDIEHGNWGHSIVKEFSPEGEIVHCETLEDFIKENKIDQCDFIKFNCEGAEFGIILSTSIETLKRIKTMLILYHCDLVKNHDLNELTTHLRKANFLIVKRFQFGERGWLIVHRNFLRHILLNTKHLIKRILGMGT